jgi:hypothetical protein
MVRATKIGREIEETMQKRAIKRFNLFGVVPNQIVIARGILLALKC